MRKVLLAAALSLGLPAVAAAQDAGGQGRPAMQNTVEWLLKEGSEQFKATPEQVAKLQEIAKKFGDETAKLRQEMQKVRGEMQSSGDRMTGMQKMRPIREELQKKDDAAVAEALKLLTDDQKKIAEKLIAERREQMMNRRGRPNRSDIIR